MSSAVGARLLKSIIVESSRKVFLHFLLLLSSSQTKGQSRPFAACLRTAQIHSGAFLLSSFIPVPLLVVGKHLLSLGFNHLCEDLDLERR